MLVKGANWVRWPAARSLWWFPGMKTLPALLPFVKEHSRVDSPARKTSHAGGAFVCPLLLAEQVVKQTVERFKTPWRLLFIYLSRSFAKCIRSRMRIGSPDLWFIGDSRVRNLYAAVNSKVSNLPISRWGKKFGDFRHIDKGTGMQLVSQHVEYRTLIQFKDIFLPVKEFPLWR